MFRRINRFGTTALTAVTAIAALITLTLSAGKAAAQTASMPLIFQPGDDVDNIIALPWRHTVTQTLNGVFRLDFDPDPDTRPLIQKMRLGVDAPAGIIGFSSAQVTGRYYVVFCVPRSGQGTCDNVSDPTAPDVTASVTFQWGAVGALEALGPFSKSTFVATASIVEQETEKFVNYLELDRRSVANGSVKVVKSIPIPIPSYVGANITQPVTFTSLLKRGRRYRFMLSAAITAKSGLSTVLTPTGLGSHVNFHGISAAHPLERGFVELQNLSVQIGQDAFDTLEQRVIDLETRVTALEAQTSAQTAATEAAALDAQEDAADFGNQLSTLIANLQGAQGPEGPQGPAGPTGLPGEGLISGSFLMLKSGSSPPSGYTFVGTFDLAPTDGARGRRMTTSVDVYRKN